MCQTFIPLLAKDGRIVNVSSTGSSLGQYSKEIQQRFRNPKMTLEDLEGMMQQYQVYEVKRYLDCAHTDRLAPKMAPKGSRGGQRNRIASAKHASML